MKLEGLTINFLGDSITAGVGPSSKDKIFHAVMAREVGLKEARNYGISGTRFAYQRGGILEGYPKGDNTDNQCFNRRFQSMADDADVVVVFGGTNDFGHGDAELGTMSDRTPDTFYGACHYMFEGLIKKYIGKPVVIMTPLHRLVETSAERGTTLLDYVKIIREVAEFYSLPVLDLYAASGIQPQIPEQKAMYAPDGLHTNDAGNEVIAHKLIKFFENL